MSAEITREPPRARVEHPRCPFCHEGVRPAAAEQACVGCMAWHPEGCWSEDGVARAGLASAITGCTPGALVVGALAIVSLRAGRENPSLTPERSQK